MPPIAAHPKPSKTRRGWVAKAILRSIFTGQFKGGDRLVEEELAVTLGVSRTPIREALGELAGIYLISMRPNHGAVVSPWGPKQVRELYHIRRLLESEAARLAAPKIDLAAVSQLREEHQHLLHVDPRPATWSNDILQLDARFHDLVATSSGSERLAEEIFRYRNLIDSIRETIRSASAQELALTEHTAIIDCLLARDANRAAEAMSGHITRGTESAVTALFNPARTRAMAGSNVTAAGGISVGLEGSRQDLPPPPAPAQRRGNGL
jgi:DNA-binding GntR family transcriptional regulator